MRTIRAFLLRLGGLFNKARQDRKLAEEIESNLQLHIEDNLRAGMSPEDARRDALLKFGGIESAKEACRARRGFPLLDALAQDLRYTFRMFGRNPGFTLVAVLTLALGIGANTAIFSVVNALVFNPLPYPDPQQLVWVTNVFRGDELIGGDIYFTYQAQSKTFDHLTAFEAGTVSLTVRDESQVVNSVWATASLFPVLGVTPLLGRAFTPEEDRPGAPRVVVLSHDFWQRRFGGNPAIIGQSLTLDGESRHVIGVMPPGFRFLPERRLGGMVDVWLPRALDPQQELGGEWSTILENVIGRLKPGVSVRQAQSELDLILRSYTQSNPKIPPGFQNRIMPLAEKLVGHLRRGLLVLFGAVGFVLLIACANVANLLLARANARRKEMAIRAALGAGRKRLVRQMLTESLLLSVIGGTAGLLLALLGVKIMVALTPDDLLQLKLSRIDATVLGFTFLSTLFTGVVAGLIPGLRASRIDLNESLKNGVRGVIFLQHKSGQRVSPILVIGELALTLVLLIGAGLLIKSFLRLRAVDPGYNPENLLILHLTISSEKYPPGSAQQKFFHRELLKRINSLPGVQAAASSGTLPMIDTGITNKPRLTFVGRPPVPDEQKPLAEPHLVSPDYFRAMGMELRAGRGFTELDSENMQPVVVINENLARRHFAGENPIGKRILHEHRKAELTIVGVVADVKRYGLAAEVKSEVYYPYFQNAEFPLAILLAVRTVDEPLKLVPTLRQQVRALEPDQPIYSAMTMEQRLSESVAPRRFQMTLFGIFAALALIIATVGIYGVISYAVSQRTHEIGIRMALGAQASDVLLVLIWRGMSLTLSGVAIGLAAALALTRVLKNLLFEVSTTDPTTFALIALLLVGIALIASYIPARRATKVDPITVLRCE